ncbi:hypothetical protein pEaSNUABM30_00063 [Erwinia phage pEa_SNUABM_30]|uniref:Uncharacterized protein n=1 Tax=Erwinia phage pEa_SNUABM_30 TaxID=2869553 RepID=A0AAE8XMJ7_9CAUD|nr:hypothetical protein MPK69_gp063 [Erwinia phage pEa_SNUABM_30]UAW53181.1 hypothetical protein pEaSNUABM30_00063 [Erwinia phage pEa_SNUABM_30]
MELKLPPFKTRSVLVENMEVRNKHATAVVAVSETSWWGYRKRNLRVAMKCNKITRKEIEWSALVKWDDGYIVAPICEDSDVLTVANNTLRDMRNMNLQRYEQLLAHRLTIHMRKHHGRTCSLSV